MDCIKNKVLIYELYDILDIFFKSTTLLPGWQNSSVAKNKS